MARLGRGRRSRAKITRNRSAITPTPLVRNRVVQHNTRRPILRRRMWRKPQVKRAPSVPTPTPLVRNRVVVVGQRRRAYLRRVTHRNRPIIVKARSVPTPPGVRHPIIRVQQRRPGLVRVARRHRPIILHSVVQPQRGRVPIVHMRRRAFRRQHQARLIRSRVFAVTFNDVVSGTITFSGSVVESQSHSSAPTGTITLSGSANENFVPPFGTSNPNWVDNVKPFAQTQR